MSGRNYELAEPERNLVRRLIDAALIAFQNGGNPNNLTPLEAATLDGMRLKFHPLPELESSANNVDLLLLLSEQLSNIASIILDQGSNAGTERNATKANSLADKRKEFERGNNATRK